MAAMKRCWFQRHLRLATHHVEGIVAQQKAGNSLNHAKASQGQISRLNHGARGRAHQVDGGRNRLRPEGNPSHRVVNVCTLGDKAVFLHQVASDFGEAVGISITVKDWP
jgi:hypothetical protein